MAAGTDWEEVAGRARAIEANVERAIQGKEREVRLALTALLAEGHLLIEDVPGVGKTMLGKALARSIACSFRRIQFTPDLLPSDITGVNVFNQERGDFEFRPGAVFANIVLGDEINRASPKTQSALLESMEEGQVTVDTVTHQLGSPFMVIATQNPVEQEGTKAAVKMWLKQVGDTVVEGEPLLELETDKVAMEVIAPVSGVLAEIVVTEGTDADKGAVLGRINKDARAAAPVAKASATPTTPELAR